MSEGLKWGERRQNRISWKEKMNDEREADDINRERERESDSKKEERGDERWLKRWKRLSKVVKFWISDAWKKFECGIFGLKYFFCKTYFISYCLFSFLPFYFSLPLRREDSNVNHLSKKYIFSLFKKCKKGNKKSHIPSFNQFSHSSFIPFSILIFHEFVLFLFPSFSLLTSFIRLFFSIFEIVWHKGVKRQKEEDRHTFHSDCFLDFSFISLEGITFTFFFVKIRSERCINVSNREGKRRKKESKQMDGGRKERWMKSDTLIVFGCITVTVSWFLVGRKTWVGLINRKLDVKWSE